MSIIEYWRIKIKQGIDWLKSSEKELAIVLIVVFTAIFSYGLGRLSKIKELREPITIENAKIAAPAGSGGGSSPAGQGIVASKKGTKYYLSNCYSGTIKPENIITFKTETEAEQAGYGLAAACK